MAIIKKKKTKQKITSVGEDVEKSELLCTVSGDIKWYSCSGNSMAGTQKLKHRIIIWSRNPTSGYIYCKELKAESQRDICTPTFIAALFTIAKRGKQLMSIDRWVDKQNVVHAYSGVLFSLKKEIHSDTCYNMDEPWRHYAQWSQSVTKDNYWESPASETESIGRRMGARGQGEGDGSYCLMGAEFQFCMRKRCMRRWVVIVPVQQYECT